MCTWMYCQERERKQDKYSEMRKSLERLNRGYEIDQINVVFDFLGCYSKQLECQIKRLWEGEKEAKISNRTMSKMGTQPKLRDCENLLRKKIELLKKIDMSF